MSKCPEPISAQIPALFISTYSTGVQNLIHHTKLVALHNEIQGALSNTIGNSSGEVFQ